jgi:hypothetical protein
LSNAYCGCVAPLSGAVVLVVVSVAGGGAVVFVALVSVAAPAVPWVVEEPVCCGVVQAAINPVAAMAAAHFDMRAIIRSSC